MTLPFTLFGFALLKLPRLPGGGGRIPALVARYRDDYPPEVPARQETTHLPGDADDAAIDLDEGLADLTEVGSSAGATVGKALAPLRRGTVVRSTLEVGAAATGNERL